jgi:hypothetical protein
MNKPKSGPHTACTNRTCRRSLKKLRARDAFGGQLVARTGITTLLAKLEGEPPASHAQNRLSCGYAIKSRKAQAASGLRNFYIEDALQCALSCAEDG